MGADSPRVDFTKEVWPILQRSCVECHGPAKQEGSLRLDSREAAFRGGDSGPSVVAGEVTKSELLRRVSLERGHDEIMPARGEPLAAGQIRVLRRWIEQGAEWPAVVESVRHWSYIAPTRPSLPRVEQSPWTRNPIDLFVLERLEREGFKPSDEADRPRLLRRLYLDLIGLPPTPAEVDAFVADRDPQAYEKRVDQLLASDQFGVRWARPWLDYARYADSHGFQRDDLRDLWAYRDWVVAALNADMPFDRFTIEQLAGDLLPGATESQRIATGFNRNAPTNVEAGSDPEETRVNQVLDRVNTIGMIWLGSSLECAQCHDHKYDPFSIRDYYSLYAYFNNTSIEADRSSPQVPGSIRFLGPTMALGGDMQSAARAAVAKRLAAAQEQLAAREKVVRQEAEAWEENTAKVEGTNTKESVPQEHVFDVADFDSIGGATHEILSDKSVLVSGEAPDRDTYTIIVRTKLTGIRAIKLETLTDPSLPGNGPGRGDAERPNFVLNDFSLTARAQRGGQAKPVKFTAAKADFAQNNFNPEGAIDNDARTAWAINPRFHVPHWAIFETVEPIGDAEGCELTFELTQNFGGSRTIGRLRLSAIVGTADTPALPEDVAKALRTPRDQRTAKQVQTLVDHRLQADFVRKTLRSFVATHESSLKKLDPPSTLVMQELDQPRSTKMFLRGDFRTPGESVEPAIPVVLRSVRSASVDSTSKPAKSLSRLDLAEWLASRDNPLVARVTVNRWWSELFGHGIVTTPEDFGIKGEAPTHPELLDWLAVEFMDHDWSFKHLLRTIVTSATYRQSSRTTHEMLARDDQNLLYARGPRFRLEAELVRDNALAVSGLLSLKQGGIPIRPPQPDGLWIKVGGEKYDYVVSPGSEQYRRGLYVVWKRGAPYPSFVNFDANSRLACRVKRPRSNTPLQALTMLNDPVYVEAAKAFARRVLVELPEGRIDARIAYAFRLAVSRAPTADEVNILRQLYEAQLVAKLDSAAKLKEFTASIELPTGISRAEFQAWYAVAAAILNLDETMTKG